MIKTEIKIVNPRYFSGLRRIPEHKFELIRRAVNETSLDFKVFMQDTHLSGGTTSTRLARRSSNLFGGLVVRRAGSSKRTANVQIFFTGAAAAYAHVHEFGATIKGNPLLRFKVGSRWVSKHSVTIPPRMNLRKEFRAWHSTYIKRAKEALANG